MAPAGFELGYVGMEASRSDKTLAVAGDPLVARHLEVCTDQEYQANRGEDQPLNCGRCAECVRTRATLEHAGQLQQFGAVFDLTAWARDRAANYEKLQQSHYELDRTVVALLGLKSGQWIAPTVMPTDDRSPARRARRHPRLALCSASATRSPRPTAACAGGRWIEPAPNVTGSWPLCWTSRQAPR